MLVKMENFMINPVSISNVKSTYQKKSNKKSLGVAAVGGAAIGAAKASFDLNKTLKATETTLKEAIAMFPSKFKFAMSTTIGQMSLGGAAIACGVSAVVALVKNAKANKE